MLNEKILFTEKVTAFGIWSMSVRLSDDYGPTPFPVDTKFGINVLGMERRILRIGLLPVWKWRPFSGSSSQLLANALTDSQEILNLRGTSLLTELSVVFVLIWVSDIPSVCVSHDDGCTSSPIIIQLTYLV